MRTSKFKRRRHISVAAAVVVAAICGTARAGQPLLTTFNFGMSKFVENPNTGLIYATVPSLNEVAVINASTLTLKTTIAIGSDPTGLCISPDDSTVYVADQGSTTLGVISTATNTAGTPINLGANANPHDVQIGTSGRLWVLTGAVIEQINAAGVSTGPNLTSNGNIQFLYLNSGDIQTANGGATLYYAGYSTSPSYLYKWDVSGTTANGLLQTAAGGNGIDLAVSPDGASLVDTNGGGNNGTPNVRQCAVYNTSDFSIKQALTVFGSDGVFAFSPDSAVGYLSGNEDSYVQAFDLTTGAGNVTFNTTSDSQSLFVDQTGKMLFAETNNGTTEVFSTGRTALVPEPSAAALILAAGLSGLGRLRRRPNRS